MNRFNSPSLLKIFGKILLSLACGCSTQRIAENSTSRKPANTIQEDTLAQIAKGPFSIVANESPYIITGLNCSGGEFQGNMRNKKDTVNISGNCQFDRARGEGTIRFQTDSGKTRKFQGQLFLKGKFVQGRGKFSEGFKSGSWRGYLQTSDEIIPFQSQSDIDEKRKALIDLVWSGQGLPSQNQPEKTPETVTSPIPNLKNLAFVEQLTFVTPPGFQSRAFLFHSSLGRNRVVIFHQGHDDKLDLRGGGDVIQSLLDKGYDVLGFHMPLYGPNTGPSGFGPRDHDAINRTFFDKTPYLIQIYIEPIIRGINYLVSLKKYPWIAMTGVSGGGWSTTLAAAIDTRIKYSFPVAGSLPYQWRGSRDWGDGEQFEPSFLQVANFTELYAMGASNDRRQVQIHNEKDDCCFQVSQTPVFVKTVKDTLSRLGVSPEAYRFEIDWGQVSHAISKSSIEKFILPVLESDSAR